MLLFLDITLRRMHVSTLAEVLPPYVAAKWRAIGTSLKFDESVLDSIESAAGNISPEDCFSDMLYQWLSSGAPEHGKPTLRRLCKALRDGSVGEEILGICLEGSMEDMQGKPKVYVLYTIRHNSAPLYIFHILHAS